MSSSLRRIPCERKTVAPLAAAAIRQPLGLQAETQDCSQSETRSSLVFLTSNASVCSRDVQCSAVLSERRYGVHSPKSA